MRTPMIVVVSAVCFFAALSGCRSETSYYKPNWKAEDYFDDPKEIAMCQAIDRSDIAEIDKLIAEGVNVNKKGKGGMTFLLWAYPAGEASFKRILEHGGDPNVVYEQDFGYRTNDYKLKSGDSLIFLVINTTRGSRYPKYKKQFENYMQLLIDHGADINLHRKYFEQTPLHWAVFCQNRKAIRQLIDAGADLNSLAAGGQTPVMTGVDYETILLLLEAGTDYRIVTEGYWTIAHRIAQLPPHTETDRVEYTKLVSWLADRDISVERARTQIEKWRKQVEGQVNISPKDIARDDIPEGSQAPPPGPSTLTKEKLDEYVNNAP